jgi:hypothetical protein
VPREIQRSASARDGEKDEGERRGDEGMKGTKKRKKDVKD